MSVQRLVVQGGAEYGGNQLQRNDAAVTTVMRRLMTCIRSEKCVVRRFRRFAERHTLY